MLELTRARAGERAAWDALVLRLTPRLRAASEPAILSCQGKFDPDDLLQETFLAALEQLPHFRGDTCREFTAWLERIYASQLAHALRRYVFTQARDVKRERPIEPASGSSSPGLEPPDPGTSPSMRAARGEELARIERALRQLPEDARDSLVWRDRDGCEFAEIARRLGRTENAARKLVARARAELRTLLGAP